MEEIRSEFIVDAEELVEKLFGEIEELRAVRAHGRGRRQLVSRIFRHVHTIKGSAASHDAKPVSQIAHEFENVLDQARLGRVMIDEESLSGFEAAAGEMATALAAHARGKAAPEPKTLINRLRAIVAAGESAMAPPVEQRWTLPEEITRSLSAYDQQHLREAVQEGALLSVISAGFVIDTFDQKFRELGRLLNQAGEVICTVPAPEPAAPGEINFRFLYAADGLTQETRDQASALGRIEFAEVAGARTAPAGDEPVSPSPGRSAIVSEPAVVRVGLHQLDELISDASELFRDASTALESAVTEANREAIKTARTHLRRRFVDLEERLIKLRLVPLERLLERAARNAGRIAARELGKEIEFSIEGGDVGVDRSLADAIAHPLQHLVRNAIGHGIESPDERIAACKSAHGRVRIAAFSEGGHIRICVSDDGRGIAPERVAAAAVSGGIMNAGAQVSTEECLRLIFRPGFSTAEKLSDVSGRGIGLEVVDRAMAEVGGEVRVTTEPGAGTTFEMILPATLALLHCVLVRAGEQVCCIESARITERDVFEPDRIKKENDAELIARNGRELPLLRLRSLLGGIDGNDLAKNLIVVRTASRRSASGDQNALVAIAIDGIEDEHDILVRSLGRHASRWRGVTGATELMDGSVALVLDVEQLLERRLNGG